MFSGVLKTPPINDKKPGKDALPLTVICDNIRDPGNLGSILRGAAGVGCQKVILTKGLFTDMVNVMIRCIGTP
jgi:tRNA G18 (ribose-2'-O)-methylase SpoU